MSASFESSTTKLNMGDVKVHSSYERKKRYLLVGVFILGLLTIIFASLYFTKISKSEPIRDIITESPLKTTSGSKETTAGPTSIYSTAPPKKTTYAPPKSTALPDYLSKCKKFDLRLPKDVVPLHYDVILNTNLSSYLINGSVTLQFNVTKTQSHVLIHARGYDPIKVSSLRDEMGKIVSIDEEYYCKCDEPKNSTEDNSHKLCNENIELYVIKPSQQLGPGVYNVSVNFQYKLTGNLKGYYKSTYTTTAGEKKTIGTTQMQPVDARASFPCMDEPALKATFSITLGHDKNLTAIGNMPIEKSWNGDDGQRYDKFETTPKVSTYLVAWVVCDFKSLQTKTTPGNVTNSKVVSMKYYAPEEMINQIKYAVNAGREMIEYFEEYFDLAYPLPKADMIAIPDFSAGAMENWGLITYRTSALLWDPKHSSESNKYRVASVISHELAHQWFGNIVTMDWWSDLWLNEGFASYVEYLGVQRYEPTWKAMDDMIVADQRSAFSLDALVTSHPIYVPVRTPSQIGEIFDSISYNKGASILRQLNDVLGEDAFKKGLRDYLKKYQYANAKSQDLWASLSQAATIDVGKFMDTWTLQMGFPVINVNRIGKDIRLTQERFLLDRNPDYSKSKYNSSFGYKWEIMVYYKKYNVNATSIPAKRNHEWMNWNKDDGAVTISNIDANEFLKLNDGHYGFYKVNYDTESWERIIDLLKNNTLIFDRKDRAGMLNDVFDLARSGRLNYTVALDFFSYIKNEKDVLPWRAGNAAIGYIPSVLTDTKPALKEYKKFIGKMVQNQLNNQKMKFDSKNLTHDEIYIRNIVLGKSCYVGNQQCLDEASKLFAKWKQDPENSLVPPDLRNLVYFYGILNGGVEEWDFMWDQFMKTQVASEKYKLLYGLSAAREPWVVDRYLSYGLDESKVRSQDASYVFSYVANYNPNGRFFAWNYMTKNWDKIQERFGQSFFTMRRIFSGVSSGFTTQYELTMVQDFAKSIKDPGTAERIILQSQEKIKSTIEWLSTYESTIESWLTEWNKKNA